MKKALELASICDQQIFIAIFDKQYNTVTKFSTADAFTLESLVEMVIEGQRNANNQHKAGKVGANEENGEGAEKKLPMKVKELKSEQLMDSFYRK